MAELKVAIVTCYGAANTGQLAGAVATLKPAATRSTICMEKERRFHTPWTQYLTMSKGPW